MKSDIWGGRAHEDYLSVVSYYLDSKWIFKKRIIGFNLIDSNHTTKNICEHILSVVTGYGISNCIISITLDNATANTKAIGDLEGLVSSYTEGFLLHQYCACHMIRAKWSFIMCWFLYTCLAFFWIFLWFYICFTILESI